MSEQQAAGFKPKKSVALSGVTAGNTALCTVGRTGNDLHYRGYDILDLAESSEFETFKAPANLFTPFAAHGPIRGNTVGNTR